MSQVIYIYPACDVPSCWNFKSVLARSLNYSASPCNNFYHFVCDGWKARSPKRELVFSEVQTRVARAAVSTLLRIRNVPARQQSAVQKAAAMFRTCIEVLHPGENKIRSLKNFLKTLGLANVDRNAVDVLDILVNLALNWNVPVFFKVSIEEDDSDQVTLHLKRNAHLLEWFHRRSLMTGRALHDYIASASEIIGRGISVESLILMEHDIVIMLGAMNEVSSETQAVKVSEMGVYTPGISWKRWTEVLNRHLPSSSPVLGTDVIKITDPDYFRSVSEVIVDEIRRRHNLVYFVIWFIVQFTGPFVSLPLISPSFQTPAAAKNYIYNRCYQEVNEILPYAFGAPFVVQSVPSEVRGDVLRMIRQIKDSLEASFRGSRWMDNATKKTAIEKLQSMRVVVAYPDYILNGLDDMYSTVPDAGPVFLDSRLKFWYVHMKIQKDKLWKREPRDERISGFTLTDVNAFYRPSTNTMIIPAGIINPPFYTAGQLSSANFGGLGHIVAHEIVHGFDVESSCRDPGGERRDWWSKETRLQYQKRLSCLRAMYDTLPFPLKWQQSSVSENMADSVGLAQAHKAYETAAKGQLRNEGLLVGFTPEQAFYVVSCFKWCSNRDAPAPGYSPEELRCNVPLKNIPDFAKAFGCRRNDPMNPEHKCNFW